MNAKILLTAAMASVCLAGASVHGGVLASDNADNLQYAPQPNHNWSVINGGFGYNPWTPLADRSGGGTYMEGVGVNNRQVDGNSSFALSAGGGAYDISRPLVTPLAGNTWYQFDILLRFDTAYFPGASLVNLRAGNNMAGFAAGELFSFGIVNGAELSYTDGSGFHPLGFDARGPVFDLDVIFNPATGQYSATVTPLGRSSVLSFDGVFEPNGNNVGSFAILTSSPANQLLIFDQPTISTVPEPGTVTMAGLGLFSLFAFRSPNRRDRKRGSVLSIVNIHAHRCSIGGARP